MNMAEGVIEPSEALEVQQSTWAFFKRVNRPLRVLIDLRKTTDATTRSKKILADTIREDSPQVIKTAIIFPDHLVKARARIVYIMGQRKDIEYFSDEKAALDWLRSL